MSKLKAEIFINAEVLGNLLNLKDGVRISGHENHGHLTIPVEVDTSKVTVKSQWGTRNEDFRESPLTGSVDEMSL